MCVLCLSVCLSVLAFLRPRKSFQSVPDFQSPVPVFQSPVLVRSAQVAGFFPSFVIFASTSRSASCFFALTQLASFSILSTSRQASTRSRPGHFHTRSWTAFLFPLRSLVPAHSLRHTTYLSLSADSSSPSYHRKSRGTQRQRSSSQRVSNCLLQQACVRRTTWNQLKDPYSTTSGPFLRSRFLGRYTTTTPATTHADFPPHLPTFHIRLRRIFDFDDPFRSLWPLSLSLARARDRETQHYFIFFLDSGITAHSASLIPNYCYWKTFHVLLTDSIAHLCDLSWYRTIAGHLHLHPIAVCTPS